MMYAEHRVSVSIAELIEFQPDALSVGYYQWWCRLCSPHQPPLEPDVNAIMAAALRHFIDAHRAIHIEEITNE